MRRVTIRNNQSPKDVKPRVFDALIDDDGNIYFEAKVNKNAEVVSLNDVMMQIAKATLISKSK